MHIHFSNIKRENATIQQQLLNAITSVVNSGHYILGTELAAFENRFSQYIGTGFCMGVGNGFDALVLALRALDIQAGDEVIVPAHTFIATWLAVSQVGATVVPVEPDESFNMSVDEISKKITSNTKAIMPVHLYGRPAKMQNINEIAKQHALFVIEDAAQAHGSSVDGIMCGNLADVAAFSFYPAKNLGAVGDAGAITTNSKKIADKILLLRNYGSTEKYVHQARGMNSRLDEIQAAVLSIKLKLLDENNKIKDNIAKRYLSEINNHRIELPPYSEAHVFIAWHQFVIKVESRASFIKHMSDHGIETLIHYPIPPHESGAYCNDFKKGSFPKTSQLCKSIVSIPIYATLLKNEIDHIIYTINNYG